MNGGQCDGRPAPHRPYQCRRLTLPWRPGRSGTLKAYAGQVGVKVPQPMWNTDCWACLVRAPITEPPWQPFSSESHIRLKGERHTLRDVHSRSHEQTTIARKYITKHAESADNSCVQRHVRLFKFVMALTGGGVVR